MVLLGVILILLALGFFIGSINITAEEQDVKFFIIGSILAILLILGGIGSIRYDNYRASENFKYAIENQKYETT